MPGWIRTRRLFLSPFWDEQSVIARVSLSSSSDQSFVPDDSKMPELRVSDLRVWMKMLELEHSMKDQLWTRVS